MVDEDSDKSLQNFMKYRNSDLVKKYPHDNAQLLTWVWWKHGSNKQTLYIKIFELLMTNTVCVKGFGAGMKFVQCLVNM